MLPATTSIEKENLEAHVELCAQRYLSLDNRLTTIDDKVSDLQVIIQNSHTLMIKVFSVAMIGIVGMGVIGILFLIITR